MTTQQTTEFMLKLLNWWQNLYRENDPDEMSDAWAVSLTDVPYDAAMPIELVSMMLGHEQISTTQIYLDIRDDDLQAAHRKYVV